MRLLVVFAIFLVLLSLFLDVSDSEPKRLRFRYRYRTRRYICRPVNCAVNNWSRWSHCSQSCGPSGVQTRHRHVTRSQKCGGHCSYALHQSRPCSRFCLHGGNLTCSKYCRCKYGYYGKCCEKGKKGAPRAPRTTRPSISHRPTTGPKPTRKRHHCWSEWVYSDCTKPCGCGYKARTRYCKCGAGKYGSCKGLAVESFQCNCQQCGPPDDA